MAMVQVSSVLAPQEHNVLKLLSDGLGTMAIAEALQMNPRTVQNYITSLRQKTGCRSRIALVEWYRHSQASSVLTAQELRVLSLLADGFRTVEIAEALQINPRTVQNYITAIRQKTGCRQRTELVLWYQRSCTLDEAE